MQSFGTYIASSSPDGSLQAHAASSLVLVLVLVLT
jgi:hypothetical protein